MPYPRRPPLPTPRPDHPQTQPHLLVCKQLSTPEHAASLSYRAFCSLAVLFIHCSPVQAKRLRHQERGWDNSAVPVRSRLAAPSSAVSMSDTVRESPLPFASTACRLAGLGGGGRQPLRAAR